MPHATRLQSSPVPQWTTGAVRGRGDVRATWLAFQVFLTCLPLLFGCSSPTDSPPTLKTLWFAGQTGIGRAAPFLSGDTVIFSTGDGHIIARAASTGSTLWMSAASSQSFQGENFVRSGGTLAAAAITHTVGLDATAGNVRWRYRAPLDTIDTFGGSAPGQVAYTTLAADSSTIYIPAWGASVSAVDAASGVARWVWIPGRSPSDTAVSGVFRSGATGVAVVRDTVYATVWHYRTRTGMDSETWLVALDARTGQELWRVTFPELSSQVASVGAPLIVGDLALVDGLGTPVWAVNRATREIVWRFMTTTRFLSFGPPAESNGVLVFDSADDSITAVAVATGQVRWKAHIIGGMTGAPLITDTRVVVGTGKLLRVLDRNTGEILLEALSPNLGDNGLVTSSATARDDQVFVTVLDGAWSFRVP